MTTANMNRGAMRHRLIAKLSVSAASHFLWRRTGFILKVLVAIILLREACDRSSQCFFVALPMRCDLTDHLREAFWGVSIRHYFFLTKTDASSLNVFS